MDIRIAEAIMHDFGKFLELSHGALMGMFLTEIPESLLPYPKAQIEEGLVIMRNYFNSTGENEAVQHIETCLSSLMFYVEDEVAIKSATRSFTNGKLYKKLLQSRIERQDKLFHELIERITKQT